MSFYSTYTGEIIKGDLVAIAYDNYMTLGIYVGRGKGGTFQYYDLNHIINVEDVNLPKVIKSYVNSPHTTRIIKVLPEALSMQRKEEYEKAMHYLKTRNYLEQ